MGAPTTDRGGIQQAIRALKADGWELYCVFDGGEDVVVSNEKEAIEAIEATGMAHLHVYKNLPSNKVENAWIFFVLGNDPDEVICDYTTNLECIDKLTNTWY